MTAAALGFAAEQQLSVSDRWMATALSGFMALAAGAMAWRLGHPRGAVLRHEARDLVGLMLTGPRDIWWIDRATCAGVRISRPDPDRTSDEGLHGVVLVRHEEPEIMLVETPDPILTEDAAAALRAGLDLPLLEESGALTAAATQDGEAWIRVSSKVALHGVMAALGVSLLGTGGIFISQVATHPAVAIFIAPVALLTGAVLLTLTLVKRLAWEEVTLTGTTWRHCWRLHTISWGERALEVEHPRWRIRVGGLRGARLELLGADGELWVGAGATSRSEASVDELSAFPARFGGG
jgi:hypothetical protein